MAWPFDGGGLFGNSIIPYSGPGMPFGGFNGGTGGGFGTGWGGSIFGGNPTSGWPGSLFGNPMGGNGAPPAPQPGGSGSIFGIPWPGGQTGNPGQLPAQGQVSQVANGNWGGITPWPGPGNLPRTNNNLWPVRPDQAVPNSSNYGNAFAQGPGAFVPGGLRSREGASMSSPIQMQNNAPTQAPVQGSQYGAYRWSGGIGSGGPFGQRQQQNMGQGWQNIPLPAPPQAPQPAPTPWAMSTGNIYTGKPGG